MLFKESDQYVEDEQCWAPVTVISMKFYKVILVIYLNPLFFRLMLTFPSQLL